jgi:hypothetical protein
MSITGGSITLTIDDYNGLQNAKSTAENEAASLKRQLIETRLNADPAGTIRALTASQRRMLHIIRFAVGNLPPESVRGWPTDVLTQVSADILQLADATTDDAAFAAELLVFVEDCKKVDRFRAARDATKQVEIVDMRAAKLESPT